MMLRCEENTPEMGKEVLTCFKATIYFGNHFDVSSNFEHGQWWITCLCGASWSVSDSEGGDSIDGFDFDQIDDGDEEYHRQDDPDTEQMIAAMSDEDKDQCLRQLIEHLDNNNLKAAQETLKVWREEDGNRGE